MSQIIETANPAPTLTSLLPEKRHRQMALASLGIKSFKDFCRHIMGFKDMNAEHEALCEFMQYDESPMRMILMPRYTFKSSISTLAHTLWLLANHPNLRVLLYSDATEKAEGFLSGIKNHITKSVEGSLFRPVYGAWETDSKRGNWNQSSITISKRTSQSIEPSIDTAGIETSKTGKHYDHLKFDDIVSDKNITTKELMDKVEDVIKNADALLARSGRTDFIGTRWHYGDAYGRLIAQYRGMPGLSIFIRKAYEGDKYFFQDIGKESLTREKVEFLRWKWGSYKFSCLMQNEPVDDETATFKTSDFSFYDPHNIPTGLYITACLDPIPPHEKGAKGDDAALTICGTDHELNLYILEIIAGRLQPSEQIEWLFRMHQKWNINTFGVETNNFQKVMRRDIEFRYKEERMKNPRFRFFSIEEFVGTSLPNKELRIRGLQPYHERGALRFPGTSIEKLPGKFLDLAYQLIHFPRSAKDDLADSLAGHIRIHLAGTKHKVTKEILPTSAIWFERRQHEQALKERQHLPRWKRPPLPQLSFS